MRLAVFLVSEPETAYLYDWHMSRLSSFSAKKGWPAQPETLSES